jgi:hypothetical protein
MALEIEEHELDALLDGIEVLEPEGPRRRIRYMSPIYRC